MSLENVPRGARAGERIARELSIRFSITSERAPARARKPGRCEAWRFELLREQIAVEPSRAPDVGPYKFTKQRAIAVGARTFLSLSISPADERWAGATDSSHIRARQGGLPFVKALGFE